MKKVIIALSGMVLIAVVFIFVVNAQDANRTDKKSSTVATTKCSATTGHCTGMEGSKKGSCPGMTAGNEMKCDKPADCQKKCDMANCKKSECNMDKSKECPMAKSETATKADCASTCQMHAKPETK